MDFLDFFENIGLGLGIILVVGVIIFLLMIASTLLPVLIMGIGRLFYILIILIVFGGVIYFIGKFAKGFIRR